MTRVDENIYVGSLSDYRNVMDNHSFRFVQACKTPCHEMAVGGTLPQGDAEYYVAKRSNGIALNMIDGHFGYQFHNVMFDESLDFIYRHREENKILIHCNLGRSRSPSIALLYMAKEKRINNESFEKASEDFKKLYPDYNPGMGIQEFLKLNWSYYILRENQH